MKQLIIVALSAILFISGINSLENDPKALIINESYEKADRLLNKMTLREKIGQMTQITVDVIGKGSAARRGIGDICKGADARRGGVELEPRRILLGEMLSELGVDNLCGVNGLWYALVWGRASIKESTHSL